MNKKQNKKALQEAREKLGEKDFTALAALKTRLQSKEAEQLEKEKQKKIRINKEKEKNKSFETLLKESNADWRKFK